MKKSEQILERFRRAFDVEGKCRYKKGDKYIYYVGGILSMLKNGNHYIAVDGRWEEV